MLELRALLRSVADHQHGFHVLAGDFNTVAPGESLDVGQLPMRIRPLVWLSGGACLAARSETVQDAGYVDGFRLKHPDEPGCTLPTSTRTCGSTTCSSPQAEAGRLLACDVVRVPGAIDASDHFPVVADFTIDPQ